MQWKDFLNPRSMLTPGIAGSVVMVIANTLWVEFMLPQKWTALILSFMLIIPILMTFSASVFENVIYFIFNGLIIFSLAANTNFAGRKLQELSDADKKTTAAQKLIAPFKSLQAKVIEASDTEIRPKQINNNLQLASNDNQQVLTISENRSTGENPPSDATQKEKEKAEKEKAKDKQSEDQKNKDNRDFFGKWF